MSGGRLVEPVPAGGRLDASGSHRVPVDDPATRRHIPDLAVLPPLLHATPPFRTLSGALGPGGSAPGPRGRHAAVTAVPHGAKTFLAAALALAGGERVCWIARDAEIGDRVADELVAWLGDPAAVAVLEPRTALAYERSELVRDESAARVAALAAWRAGRARVLVASVQALLQPTLGPDDLPEAPRPVRRGDRQTQGALLADLLRLGYEPVHEVAGRGEFARRGGLVDVFAAGAELPVRIEFFGDEIDSLRRFDPTDQRTVGPAEAIDLLPASEFLLPAEGPAGIRARLGGLALRLPERLAADLAHFEGVDTGVAPGAATTRALEAGDAAEVWAAILCPATGLDHLAPETLLVLDEPGDVASAAEFLWEQAAERRRDLVAAGELPAEWPDAYLPAGDWSARLARGRTLELTWESGPGAAIGGGAAMEDPFGWREPMLPPGRSASLPRAIERWRAGRPATVPIADEEAESIRPVVPPGIALSPRAAGSRRPPLPQIVIA
ncbi:MAG: hypothetical protein P4L30_09695, partial [Candidatus Limnocylindrales bacterium]|nr:hypothetical protein [Candidatus Limnocylindrales bacterium]